MRADLDANLSKAIADPGRLSDTQVARATAGLLTQAENTSNPGERLRQQIQQLQQLLERANRTVTVTLTSDQQTEVILYKVARMGRFSQQQLDLRPGEYTVVGTRIGYRDVRLTFTVDPDGMGPIYVACTEQI